MNLEQAFETVCKLISKIADGYDITGVNSGKLNLGVIKGNMLTSILNTLIAADTNFLLTLEGLTKTINNINSSIGNLADEKVKINPDYGAGYLKDLIVTLQAGSIKIDSVTNTMLFMGFVPIGAQFMISKTRLSDFDNTGKGKPSTDVYGYAISNGQNNTTNRLGVFPKYVGTTLNTAGEKAGVNTVTLVAANIPSFDLAVTGSIGDGLLSPISPQLKVDLNKISDGSGGNTLLVRYTPNPTGGNVMTGVPMLLTHSHTFDLTAKKINANPTSLSIIPEHILEIPIERITI